VKSRTFCLVCGLWLTIHCSETHLNENYRNLIKTCFFVIYTWFVLSARFENVNEVSICTSCKGDRGSTVPKVLRYKSEVRWFDPSWCHLEFFIGIKSFRSHYGPGVDSASNRNEYQEYFLGVKAAGT